MPGYQQYQKVRRRFPARSSGAVPRPGALTGPVFEYTRDGKRYRYDVAARQATAVGDAADAGRRAAGAADAGRRPRSAAASTSRLIRRTAKLRARSTTDRNLYLVDRRLEGRDRRHHRRQREAPDQERHGELGLRRGARSEDRDVVVARQPQARVLPVRREPVPDYYLQLDQTQLQSVVDTEAYPKAGAPIRSSTCSIYDVASKKTTRIDVRDGKPFDQRRGRPLRLSRLAGRRDGTRAAVQPHQPPAEHARARGRRTRTPARPASIIREEWPTGWIENSPAMTFLKDGRRFIWESERNGWSNFYLYDLSGKLIAPLTTHTAFEVGGARQGRRGGRRDLLHGARRRQPPEDAAASRRSRRHEATCG